MDLDATPYRAFVAVAEERSFTRAAQRINLSQPALSSQIRELERRLGFRLFARTSRRVELTTEGRLFLGNARRMVAETAWIAQAARDIRSNQLRIGAPLYTMLIPERRRFLDRLAVEHPELRLRIFDRAPAKYYADLARGEIDLAILLEPSRPRGHDSEGRFDGDWPDGFERCRLGERRLGLLVPAEHPWAAMDEVPRAALKGSPIVTINRSQGVPLSEAVGWALGEPGATPVRPPEGNAIGAERHGRLTRTPAVTLGWFDYPDRPDGSDMVVRFVAGLTLSTSLVVIRTRGEKRPAAARFWELALAAAAEGEKIFLSSVRNVGI